jgi:hypothetical protein
MTKQISNHAAAAKMIRAELKKHGIKARVRAKSYAGSSSVDVDIQQDILPAARKAITEYVEQFQYGHFDGMQDLYEYSNRRDDLPQVKYTFVNVEYSDEIRAEVAEFLGETNEDYNADTRIHQCLMGVYASSFWNSRKPKVKLPLAGQGPALLRNQAE